jgi:hypothetical protein
VRSRRGGAIALVVVLVVAVVVGVVLSSRVEPVPPFDIDSARPDGLKALRLLLEEQGVEVRRAPASSLTDGGLDLASDAAIVMIAPSVASEEEVAALEALTSGGGLVVYGQDPGSIDPELGYSVLDEAQLLGDRALADELPFAVGPGSCDMAALEDLGDIDTAFAVPITPSDQLAQCYTEGDGAHFFERAGADGTGTVVTISSPFLWVNARLQPRKEDGGEPLDNGATAVRLLGGSARVTFIDPVPSSDDLAGGDKDPLTLLPLPVKLALAQLVGAFVLFLWWRSRRLGPPVREQLPVEVAGSELVAAVGDLLRRRGNPQRAAGTVRAETRRVLAERIGLGAEPAPAALVEVVAARTGRPAEEVGAALYGDPSAPVTSAGDLVALVRTLDTIRQEVLHVGTR